MAAPLKVISVIYLCFLLREKKLQAFLPTTRQTESASHRGVAADHDAQFWYPSCPDQGIGWGTKCCWCRGGTSAESWGLLGSHPRSSCMLRPTGSDLPPITVCEVWQSLGLCKTASYVIGQSSPYRPAEDLAPWDPLPSR